MTWPKTFHRIWFDEPERSDFAAFAERLQELHPDWEIQTWGSSEAVRALIDDTPLRDLWDRYMESDPFGRIPDIARYLLLWNYGGVYIDTDFEPIRPMDALLEDPRPFAGWENDRTMCTALLGAPKHHPAIGVLLDGLVERLHATERQTANNAVGPEYATALWRERDDVRRFPPSYFYPIGWWEKQLLGKIDLPSDTYAVHWWNKGWGSGKRVEVLNRGTGVKAKVSLLVPFRDVDGYRDRSWAFVRERLERLYPEAEIIVASDDGEDPFYKTLALNRAAAEATGDVFVIYDADTLVAIDDLREMVEVVANDPMRWGQPYGMKVKLNEAQSELVMGAGRNWDGTVDLRATGQPESRTGAVAPPTVLSRQAWDLIGGADERFRGWGSEDTAMQCALSVLVGKMLPRRRGQAMHLWHPRLGVSGNDMWPGQDIDSKKFNIWLQGRYRQARTPQEMRALLEERDAEPGTLHDGNRDVPGASRRDAVGVR